MWNEKMLDIIDNIFLVVVFSLIFSLIFTLGYCSRDVVEIVKSHTIVKKEPSKED